MCSIGDEGIEDEGPAKFMEKKLSLQDKTCVKCKTNRSVILLRSKDCYCKECFVNGTLHKFKAFLGKLRLSRRDEKVLVSYKTGHVTCTLLQFLRNGLDTMAEQKRLKFQPIFIYVEKNYHLSLEERKNVLKTISEHVNHFNFKLYMVSFGDYIKTGQLTLFESWNTIKLSEDNNDIYEILKEKTKLTYQKEIFHIFERDLLIKSAKSLGCSFIFTTDLTADIAVNLLTNVSLGRGNQLPLDIGVIDDRDEIKIIKPMRHLNMKECVFYNYFNNVEPVITRVIDEKPYSSVQNLLTNFIDKLQVDYPATVTTVLRTGDKLSMDLANQSICEFCKAPIFMNKDKFISAEATNFSRHLSTMQLNMDVTPTERYEKAVSSYSSSDDKKDLCYSCKIISEFIIK
nr:cytoplasmic tRNA 2-thiolation protein 2 [Onthophagus taurus]